MHLGAGDMGGRQVTRYWFAVLSLTRIVKVLTANSLHSSVSRHIAHIRHLHRRKHNLFDVRLPTLPMLENQCLTSIAYSEQAGGQGTDRQTERQAKRQADWLTGM